MGGVGSRETYNTGDKKAEWHPQNIAFETAVTGLGAVLSLGPGRSMLDANPILKSS